MKQGMWDGCIELSISRKEHVHTTGRIAGRVVYPRLPDLEHLCLRDMLVVVGADRKSVGQLAGLGTVGYGMPGQSTLARLVQESCPRFVAVFSFHCQCLRKHWASWPTS